MTVFRSMFLFCIAAGALPAQMAAPIPAPDEQPDTQAMVQPLRTALRDSPASETVKAQAASLLEKGEALQAAGRTGEMRRVLANALAVLNGQTWDRKLELAWSLALRPERVVTDASVPLGARLSQFYPFPLPEGLRLRAELVKAGSEKPVRQLGVFPIPSRDLVDQPLGFEAHLEGLADGAYQLRAQLLEGETVVATVTAPVEKADGILAQRAAVDERLSHIQGHESTKATIRSPYALAETINTGRRHLNQADFGIPFTPQAPYNFQAGMRRSEELLKALESGKDPLWQAKGDHERHYWFEEAGEMMPYRMYVPEKWDGRSRLPMVFVLHGATRDHNFYFDRDGHILARLAEQYGYLVVCPFGYRPTGGWGASAMMGIAAPRQSQLSEQDALNVFELVTKEYPIDASRTYLFGHSMGGSGAWHFGQKFPGRWAAVAASAAATNKPEAIPYERLKDTPLMLVVGDKDSLASAVRTTLKLAREHGLNPEYVEVPGATHETIVAIIEPRVFEFFDRHRRP